MPEEFTGEIRHEALEADIARLSQEVRTFQERPESRAMPGQEIVKQSIKSFTSSQAAIPPEPQTPLPNYASTAPPQTKLEIEYLLDLAFHKGILEAAEAAKLHSPYVVDAFHDALAGKLYPELQRRGILK